MFKLFQKLFKRRQIFTGDDWHNNPDISMREVQAREAKLGKDLEKTCSCWSATPGPATISQCAVSRREIRRPPHWCAWTVSPRLKS
ncbi:MAG: hypothetical protein WBK64_02180 [Dethiobacteria bacterium]|uniref:Uncharacterized protein n=1 Tax=anaerobic digester metagenome TaxID=1263854 RepID=A0A485LZJ1_9ZZZZ|nr:hypothetical protein [Bacillota bacterium]